MKIPVIKVRDTNSGHEHIVGTNAHDMLSIENGGLYYINMQAMVGTRYADEGYTFVGEDMGEWHPYPVVEFVDLDEWIKIATEHTHNAVSLKIEFDKAIIKYFKEREKELKRLEDSDPLIDTSGELF